MCLFNGLLAVKILSQFGHSNFLFSLPDHLTEHVRRCALRRENCLLQCGQISQYWYFKCVTSFNSKILW